MAPAASNLAVKKKKGDDDVDPTLKRIAALFELEKAIQDGTLTPNDERLDQTEFWSAMRSILAVNELTSGVEILDDIAAALISGQADPLLAFSGPINLLPPPSRQRAGGKAPMHPAFSTGEKRSSSVAGATGKMPKPPKKQKLTLPNPPPIEPPPARAASMIDFELETVDEVIDMTGDQSQVVEGIPSGNNNDEISDSSSTASLLRKVNEKTPKTESK
ncbi:hypothetical protein PF003_g17166 [Phytophthora fragariae]|nr:hypothetical protein PF003_g17166 [Phytophthora fragariae]